MDIEFRFLEDLKTDDWGGDNYLLHFQILNLTDNEKDKIVDYLKDKTYIIEDDEDLRIDFYCTYDNMDYNGFFAKVYHIDKVGYLKNNRSKEYNNSIEFFEMVVFGGVEKMINEVDERL